MYMPDNQARLWGHMHRTARLAETLDKIALLRMAVERLTSEGHTVIETGTGPGRPIVHLAASPVLARMAEEGRGAYWMRGVDEHGQHYRKGQLLDYRNVIVTWMERGN